MILRWISMYWIDVIGTGFYLATLPLLISVTVDAYRVWKRGGGRMAFGLALSTLCQSILIVYLLLVVWARYDLAPYTPYIKGELALFTRPMAFASAVAIWWALRTDSGKPRRD